MHYAALDCCCRRLGPVLDIQLIEDALHVILDGVLGDVQDIGDLLIGQSFDNQLEHFQLACAQDWTRDLRLQGG